jgi:hypothetical protein
MSPGNNTTGSVKETKAVAKNQQQADGKKQDAAYALMKLWYGQEPTNFIKREKDTETDKQKQQQTDMNKQDPAYAMMKLHYGQELTKLFKKK